MIKTISKYRRFFIISTLCLMTLLMVAYLLINIPSNHKISLTEDGFYPKQLDVNKGDSVTFNNNTGKDFWPASDVHPDHTVYADFDPKKAIPTGESWTFKFSKVGTWPFHDHLNPLFTGTIYVKDFFGNKINNCQDSANESYGACIEKRIKDTVIKNGLEKGFELINNLYDESEEFALECHGYAHVLGESAYQVYLSNPDKFFAAGDASICGFGFYHGFMETLILVEGSPKEANKFCDLIEKSLNIYSGASCFHGIGHGAATPHFEFLYGNEQAMVEPALELCKNATDTPPRLRECYIGTYAAIASFRANKEYGLSVPQKPLEICKSQEEDKKEPCYAAMVVNLAPKARQDFADAAKTIELEIDNVEHAQSAIRFLAGPVVYSDLKNRDYADFIKDCRTLRQNLREACLEGFISAYIETSPAQTAAQTIKVFCNSPFLLPNEREMCTEYSTRVLQQYN